jgi:hypothetical protein
MSAGSVSLWHAAHNNIAMPPARDAVAYSPLHPKGAQISPLWHAEHADLTHAARGVDRPSRPDKSRVPLDRSTTHTRSRKPISYFRHPALNA